MKVFLETLALTNFRGIRSLRIDDFESTTTIYGDNQTGKTTVYNAFLWLLFGKDNLDRKDFEIKTLGPDNQPYRRLEHEVSAIMQINGEHTSLKRTYREKWVKKKGSVEAEFTGHETLLFWNDVPYKLEDFQAKVSSILKENVFKMITSTGYFNSMKWQDRRNILLELAGDIMDSALLQTLSERHAGKYSALIDALTGKSLEEYKRELSNKKKKIKDELDHMPARIEEANRSLPEERDFTTLQKELDKLKEQVDNMDQQLMDKTSAETKRQNEITAKIKKIGDLKVTLNGIEFHIKTAARSKGQDRERAILDLKSDLQRSQDSLNRINTDISSEENRVARLTKEKENLTSNWHKVNNEELKFDETKFACPTCKRAYEASGIEAKKAEMVKNFNQDKSTRLTEISTNGKRLAAEIDTLKVSIAGLVTKADNIRTTISQVQNKIEALTAEHQALSENETASIQTDIASNDQHVSILSQIDELQNEVNAPVDGDDNKIALMQQKREIASKINELNSQLAAKGLREKSLARIAELEASESTMANELANLEKIEFSIFEYTRQKMDEMESRINDRFQMVKFKMFREQVNGGQEECCETLINGVPYGVANTASQINAGLDIINVMSAHFGIHAPVFVDNRESVVHLIPSESQIINLVVVKGAVLSVNQIKYRKDFKEQNSLAVA